MKLNGVFSVFFVLVTCAYAGKGKHDDSDSSSSNSSSSSSSEVEICEPAFTGRHRPGYYDRRAFERCDPCEPQMYVQHHKRHHHKGVSKHCKRLLCDVKCLVGESYLYIGQSICAQFSELGVCAKRSMEKTGDKVEKDVVTNMNKLEREVLDIVKEPLYCTIKKIEDVISRTNKDLAMKINMELERFDERNKSYFKGLIGIAVDILQEIIKDIAGGVHPNVRENTKELQRGVTEAMRTATIEEMKEIQVIAGEFMKDVTKDIQKAFQGSEALVRSLIEKIFEKESNHLVCLIRDRTRLVENRLRFVVVSVEREIEKAISCVSSSKGRDCGIIRTKLAMFTDPGHQGSEMLV